jgi:hypothetical protein
MRRPLARIVATIAAVAIVAGAFVLFRDRLQSRPERDDTSSVDFARVRVQTRLGLDAGIVIEGVWAYCHATVDGTRLARPIARIDDTMFELVLEPSMGSQARRRFTGCVNDGIIDRAKTELESIERVPRSEAGL